MTIWQRWVKQPQGLLVREALFQIHLWTGIAIGLYMSVICATGSILVYRNELYRAFSPKPTIVSGSGILMSAEELTSAALLLYPAYEISEIRRGETANHAIEITLKRGSRIKRRLLHPFTAEDLGDPLPAGFRFTAWLRDLHDNLLGGETGRRVNGVGALSILVVAVTGAFIWWPGVGSWRRSLTVNRRSNWTRLNWRLHSTLGFWFFVFILMWGLTGAYLSFPGWFSAAFDYVEPFDNANPVERVVDSIQYWLAYLHFGRLGGRGIPGCGVGVCDSITKMIWAAVGLVPPIMFVTGALMWWNRKFRSGARRSVNPRSASSQKRVDTAGAAAAVLMLEEPAERALPFAQS
jgi:uncharacterized iron-regulated membrane protein